MKADNRRQLCRCNTRLHLLSSSLLFLSLILPASTVAQFASSSALPTTPGAPASVASTALSSPLLPTTFSISAGSPPANTASKPLSQSSRSTSAASRVTADNAPPLYPATTSSATSDDHDIDRDSHVINYYFVFLALIAVFALLAIYVLHKRRRRRKAQLRSRGQNALARDLDGWVNTRRWVHGSWRGGAGGGPARQEEGLNEAGEPPPPYKPRVDATTDADGAAGEHATLSSDETRDTVTGLAIPLRTLSRGGRSTLKPPDYQETIHSVSVDESTRPNTSETRPGTSTRELLHPDRPPDLAS